MRGGWNTGTISSVEQLGRVVMATTSVSIRWIRLIIRIWMSRVLCLVYWLKVITWLDDVCILDCESVYNCMINPFRSSLPFLLVYVMCVVFSFCNDHQFIDVSRCENSPWSSGWWRFRCITIWARFRSSEFLLELWPMYRLVIGLCFEILSIYYYTLLLTSWCALVHFLFSFGQL